MRLNQKLLATYYLIAESNSPSISPYNRAILLLFLNHFLFGLIILRTLSHFYPIQIVTYKYILYLLFFVWLGVLTLIYPKEKMPDLIDEFTKKNEGHIRLWKIASILSMISLLAIFLIEINCLK